MIAWGVAERVGSAIAGDGAGFAELPGDLQALGERSVAAVLATTGLEPSAPLPPPLAVDRAAWITANLGIMRATIGPLEAQLERQVAGLPGPLRGAAGSVVAAEAGAVVGYMGRRVLGQYEVVMSPEPIGTPRLLLVAPNIHEAAARLLVPLDDLLAWVTVHEVTHAVQFASAPWLRGHLAGMLGELLAGAEVDLGKGARAALPSLDDLRGVWGRARTDGILALAAGPERTAILDRMQAAMALVEGHAEHVMDAAGVSLVRDLPRLRRALDAGRTERSPMAAMLERLLGMDLKLRQYREGRAFCDAVVARAGMDGLNAAFAGAEQLPTLGEIADAELWLSRVAA